MITIVTAVYPPLWEHLLRFLDSCIKYADNNRIIVYNMGLTTKQATQLREFPIIIEELDYDWAWKINIIYQVCQKWGGKIIWFDPTVTIYAPFNWFNFTTHPIYAPIEKPVIGVQDGINVSTIKWIKYTLNTRLPIRSTICIAINYDIDWVKVFVAEWVKLTLDRRDNIFSLLYYMYLNKYFFPVTPYNINFKI